MDEQEIKKLKLRLDELEKLMKGLKGHGMSYYVNIEHAEIQGPVVDKLDYNFDKLDVKEVSGALNLGNNFGVRVGKITKKEGPGGKEEKSQAKAKVVQKKKQEENGKEKEKKQQEGPKTGGEETQQEQKKQGGGQKPSTGEKQEAPKSGATTSGGQGPKSKVPSGGGTESAGGASSGGTHAAQVGGRSVERASTQRNQEEWRPRDTAKFSQSPLNLGKKSPNVDRSERTQENVAPGSQPFQNQKTREAIRTEKENVSESIDKEPELKGHRDSGSSEMEHHATPSIEFKGREAENAQEMKSNPVNQTPDKKDSPTYSKQGTGRAPTPQSLDKLKGRINKARTSPQSSKQTKDSLKQDTRAEELETEGKENETKPEARNRQANEKEMKNATDSSKTRPQNLDSIMRKRQSKETLVKDQTEELVEEEQTTVQKVERTPDYNQTTEGSDELEETSKTEQVQKKEERVLPRQEKSKGITPPFSRNEKTPPTNEKLTKTKTGFSFKMSD